MMGEGGVVQKYISVLEKNVGGGVMPKYFMDVKKCCSGEGGLGLNLMGLIKCWGGEGSNPKYFMDLKISPDLQTTCS